MFCPRCGTKIDDGSTSCDVCGAQFFMLEPRGTKANDAQPTIEQPPYQQSASEQSAGIDEEQMWLPQSPDGYYQQPLSQQGTGVQQTEAGSPQPPAGAAQSTGSYQPTGTAQPTNAFSQQDTIRRPSVAPQSMGQPAYSQPYDEFVSPQPQKNRLPIILAVAAALVLLLGGAAYAIANWPLFTPGGSGTTFMMSEEDKIRQQVDMAISAATELSESDIEALIGDEESALLEAYGIDLPGLVKRMMGYLDYEVGEVTIDGDKAVAQVTLSFPDFGELQDEFILHVMAELSGEDLERLFSGDTSGLYEKVVDLLFETIDKYPTKRVNSTSDVSLSRQSDGSWEISEQDLQNVWNTLFKDVSGDIGSYTSMV